MQIIEHGLNGSPMPARRLAAGVGGIRQTLAILRRNAAAAAMMPAIRALAESIVSGVRSHDQAAEAAAVQAFVRKSIRYTRDPRGVEVVKPPLALLKHRSDDCDGHAQLVAALLASVGHTVRLVAIGFKPDAFAHVVAESFIGGKWLSVETTTPNPVPVGWLPQGIQVRMIAPLSSSADPELGFLKKIGKAVGKVAKGAVKTVGKVAKVAAPIAAVAIPGAGAALVAVQTAKTEGTNSKANLEVARAQTIAANTAAIQAQAEAARPPAPPPSSLVTFVEANKTALAVGGAGVLALLLLRPSGAGR